MVSDDILQVKNLDQNDVLFEESPTRPVRHQVIKPNARLELAANKIKKKFDRQRHRKDKKKKKKKKCENCKMVEKI